MGELSEFRELREFPKLLEPNLTHLNETIK